MFDVRHGFEIKDYLYFSGVLFCVGGRGASGDPFKSIEVYDPRRNRWFQVSEMNTRRRHVGVCCSGGQCLEDSNF